MDTGIVYVQATCRGSKIEEHRGCRNRLAEFARRGSDRILVSHVRSRSIKASEAELCNATHPALTREAPLHHPRIEAQLHSKNIGA